jgi:phage terminase small subunit
MTPKRKAFVTEYVKDKNGAQAAIRAGYSPKTARAIASELLTIPDVAQEIAKRQERAAEKAEFTVAAHLAKLEELRNAAIDAGQLNAAIRAEELRGKVIGFYTERVEHSGTVSMSAEQREQSVLLLLRQAKDRKQRGIVS